MPAADCKLYCISVTRVIICCMTDIPCIVELRGRLPWFCLYFDLFIDIVYRRRSWSSRDIVVCIVESTIFSDVEIEQSI